MNKTFRACYPYNGERRFPDAAFLVRKGEGLHRYSWIVGLVASVPRNFTR